MRLDRLLSNLGYGSRREVRALLKAGRVTMLSGEVARDESAKIAHAELLFDGQALDALPPLTLILHKPCGYTCSLDDPGELVYDLLPERYASRNPTLSTVGRLDKDTSGLLLLTDDGTLLHQVISPKKAIWKTYEAELDRPLSGEEAALFGSGSLMLEGERSPCLAARLRVIGPKLAQLSLTEGRYHQVRRMFAAAGNHVVNLRRVSIGGLEMNGLEAGQWRIAEASDMAKVFG